MAFAININSIDWRAGCRICMHWYGRTSIAVACDVKEALLNEVFFFEGLFILQN